MDEESNRLLEKEWSEEERLLITRVLKNVLYYKKLIPKSLKADIISALQLCNELKEELENLKKQMIQ